MDEKTMEREDHKAYLRFRNERHNGRLARSMDRLTLTGIRLHEKGKPEKGTVIALSEDEAQALMGPLSAIINARLNTES